MNTYLVLHELLGVNTSQVHPYFLTSANRIAEVSAARGAEFQECWYDASSGFLMCQWAANDEADIRAALKAAEIPVASIHRVAHFTVEQMQAILDQALQEA